MAQLVRLGRYLAVVVLQVAVLVLLQVVVLVVVALCLALLALLGWVGAVVVYLEVLGVFPALLLAGLRGLLALPGLLQRARDRRPGINAGLQVR